MIHRSTLQLLRFPFSYFLMPLFWFSLSFCTNINWADATLLFFILHVLVYPSSNGYNSYMDRDEESIGGLKEPMQPTRQLFVTTIWMDVAAILLSTFISLWSTVSILVYIIFSRLYSYRGVRLKKFALLGYITVVLNQGALTFFMVYHASSVGHPLFVPWVGLLSATFLIGGFYPITQVYQHKTDAKDGVNTISMLLGIRGTFLFCACMYSAALALLFFYYSVQEQLNLFGVIQLFFVPVLVYFAWWLRKVWSHPHFADFKHTMQMNWLASTCTSLAFIIIIILNQFG